MIVAGVMSGTSMDGVDVAICRIAPLHVAGSAPKIKLIGHLNLPYPNKVRVALLHAVQGGEMTVAKMSQLNWWLGARFADAVEATARHFGAKLDLVGCHGQTLYHQATALPFAGKATRATWQAGEASVIAERLRVPVVSDFRPADMAAGGQAAPLVPMLDYVMFRDAKKSRVLLNLGGIANVTAIPGGGGSETVMAFDTGPANMVIDLCMEELYNRKLDRNGATARKGKVNEHILHAALRDKFFAAEPPKSCGREEFGAGYARQFLAACQKADLDNADVIATATALTAQSVLDAYRRFVWPHLGQAAPLGKTELIAAGGGVKNTTLMEMVRAGLEPLGVRLRSIDDFGVPAQAKEAVAFALLGWLSWHRLPGNVPSATGASRPVVLGKLTYP